MSRVKSTNPKVTTSITISPEFHQLCREHGIEFTEAARVGISLLLAERGVLDYDNNLNVMRKMTLLRQQLETTSKEFEELKEKHAITN